MIHLLLSGLTFIDIDETHKYHDFAGVQGWIMFFVKVCLWLYFSYCYIVTNAKIDKRMSRYFWHLYEAGSAYMLSMPFSMLVCFLYAPYERKYTFDLVSHVLMFISNTYLLYSVTYKGSSY